MADFNLSGANLQSYVKERAESLTLTKPGYEVFFYSRFDQKSRVDDKTLQSFDDVPPTRSLTTNGDLKSEIQYIQSIEVVNTVADDGAQARITMVFPTGYADFFESTLGDPLSDRDYDDRGAKIGTMDTILIRLTNIRDNPNDYTQRETVFRGVIADINRVESTEGATVVLICYDFSEFFRRATAIKNGIFSTIALSLTGRGVVYTAVNYMNNLLNGNKQLFGLAIQKTDVDNALNALERFLRTTHDLAPNADLIDKNFDTDAHTKFENHAMDVPPYFYMQYADIANDATFAIGGGQAATQVFDLLKSTAFSTNDVPIPNIGANGLAGITPEDKEAISFYHVQNTGTQDTKAIKGKDYAGALGAVQQMAWTLSDLYLDRKLTFEHQRMWNLVTETASRSLRECYFDVKPKINTKAGVKSYQNVQTSELQAAKDFSQFKDVHPNIGILKYRLSPCFIPYTGLTGSEFWQYNFGTKDVISYQGSESERNVLTMVLGYGTGLNNVTIPEGLLTLATGESKGFATAQSVDKQIERRYGYRFMTDHDAKASTPILRYFVSYVQLMKTQLNMFSQQITIPGRPDIVPGSLVRLEDKNADYYCTRVSHMWSLQNGYKTILSLGYGHKKGQLPAGIADTTGILHNGEPDIDAAKCAINHKTLAPYLKGVPAKIGDVSPECLIEALWQFWSDASTDPNVFAARTKEYTEGVISGAKTDFRGDWIELTEKGKISSQYDGLLSSMLATGRLNEYNITLNLLKNLVAQESTYNPNADNGIAVGLFQINRVNFPRFGLTVDSAKDPATAAPAAASILRESFASAGSRATSESFLIGLTGYNSGPGGASKAYFDGADYAIQVLGAPQVQRIRSGKQSPQTSRFPGGQTAPWPYYCYGPLGIRVAQSKPSLGSVNPKAPNDAYKTEKKQLLTFDYGMRQSVNYIIGLLKKYNANKDLMVPGQGADMVVPAGDGTVVRAADEFFKGLDLLGKVVAAWYTNEQKQSYDPTLDRSHFQNTYNAIKALYAKCLQCPDISGSNYIQGGFGGNSLNEKIFKAATGLKGKPLSIATPQLAADSHNGHVGCVIAVQTVLKAAGLNYVGQGPVGVEAVDTFVAEATSNGGLLGTGLFGGGQRAQEIATTAVTQGDIWYINGPSNYHIGIVVSGYPKIRILSNSSNQHPGYFEWEDTAEGYYKSYNNSGKVGYLRMLK